MAMGADAEREQEASRPWDLLHTDEDTDKLGLDKPSWCPWRDLPPSPLQRMTLEPRFQK